MSYDSSVESASSSVESPSPSRQHLTLAEARLANHKKSVTVAFFLWFVLGFFGAHNFYLNQTIQGVIKILLLGFFWLIFPAILLVIWWVMDAFFLSSWVAADTEVKRQKILDSLPRESEAPSTERSTYVETRIANQKKSIETAYFLWFFFGFLGGHSFYLNRLWQGLTKIVLIMIFLLAPIFQIADILDFPQGGFWEKYGEYREDRREYGEYREDRGEYGERWRDKDWEGVLSFFAESHWQFFLGIFLWILVGLTAFIWWVADVFLLSDRVQQDAQAKRETLLKETQTIE